MFLGFKFRPFFPTISRFNQCQSQGLRIFKEFLVVEDLKNRVVSCLLVRVYSGHVDLSHSLNGLNPTSSHVLE